MKIIIIGAGKVGATLIKNFINEGHDVVILDIDADAVADRVNRFDINGVIGGGAERVALLEAGVEEADFLIACTSQDEVNILSCVIAKKLGAKHTIARVRDPQYFSEMDSVRDIIGLDLAFNPERQTAIEIERLIKFPSAKSIESFATGKALMVEFDVLEGNPIIGKTIMEIGKEYKNNVLFGIIKRDGSAIIPKGDTKVNKGDVIYIIGAELDIINFSKKLKIFKPRSKSCFIIGGGKVAYYLAKALIRDGIDVKILENDQERATFLSEELPKATILLGDGTDHSVLEEEGLKNADACVTLMGVDEQNVIVSLFAKMKGVSKVVTNVDRSIISSMVTQFGLDTVISPRKVIASHIVKHVRATEVKDGINNLYMLTKDVEAVEFTVKSSFEKMGIPLKSLNVKKNFLIGGIVREEEFVLPTGDTDLRENDRVIVVSKGEQINELRDILD
ncbi:MAG: Trk system potassium transporter TrkA [Clostridia bacterium]|nr:Trk system potassium transporter TrkA [Clostridia bacterium]